jgi:hypothetical protein
MSAQQRRQAHERPRHHEKTHEQNARCARDSRRNPCLLREYHGTENLPHFPGHIPTQVGYDANVRELGEPRPFAQGDQETMPRDERGEIPRNSHHDSDCELEPTYVQFGRGGLRPGAARGPHE